MARSPAAGGTLGAGPVARSKSFDWGFVAKWSGIGLLVFQGIRLVYVFFAWRDTVGIDYELYMSAARRWLSGGGFFLPYQLNGPYQIHYYAIAGQGSLDPLFPPVVLWLLVPFTLLPAFLFWLIPALAIGVSVWRLRPGPWSWLALALIGVWGYSWQQFLWGGPSMWVTAAAFVGVAWGWPSVLILVKPTLAPFALFGANHRSWWLALGVFALACLPFGTMWWDWLRATIINPTNGGIAYSAGYVPVMFAPLLAWFFSEHGAPTRQAARERWLRMRKRAGSPTPPR